MITTRFAPSPTGFLHLGGARTALFNWLFARKMSGRFILRIEDTDDARNSAAAVDQIVEGLTWLGLDWDEGPLFQSARMGLYEEHLISLREKDLIYPAFETLEELELSRKTAMKEKRNPIYDGPSKQYTHEEASRRMASGAPFVWRFRVPTSGSTTISESLMSDGGSISFTNADIGDFAITRLGTESRWGSPLYNLVCAVDDALMGVTHVMRGVEHLSNTPKQVLLYQAMGYGIPSFTHLPLILKNGKKMSKRDAEADALHPVSVAGRKALGYLPEATTNFLSLLGWSDPDGKELFDLEYLREQFSIERLGKSNANFDESKYAHCNSWHIRQKSPPELTQLVAPYLREAGLDVDRYSSDQLTELVLLEKDRCKTLKEFVEALEFFFSAPTSYEPKSANKFLFTEKGRSVLQGAEKLLGHADFSAKSSLEQAINGFAKSTGLTLGEVSQPLRVALTGRGSSPGIFDVIWCLGREEVLKRTASALAQVEPKLSAD